MPKAKKKKIKKPTSRKTKKAKKKAPARKKRPLPKTKRKTASLKEHRSNLHALIEKRIFILAGELIEDPFKECAKPQSKRTKYISPYSEGI